MHMHVQFGDVRADKTVGHIGFDEHGCGGDLSTVGSFEERMAVCLVPEAQQRWPER